VTPKLRVKISTTDTVARHLCDSWASCSSVPQVLCSTPALHKLIYLLTYFLSVRKARKAIHLVLYNVHAWRKRYDYLPQRTAMGYGYRVMVRVRV